MTGVEEVTPSAGIRDIKQMKALLNKCQQDLLIANVKINTMERSLELSRSERERLHAKINEVLENGNDQQMELQNRIQQLEEENAILRQAMRVLLQ